MIEMFFHNQISYDVIIIDTKTSLGSLITINCTFSISMCCKFV